MIGQLHMLATLPLEKEPVVLIYRVTIKEIDTLNVM